MQYPVSRLFLYVTFVGFFSAVVFSACVDSSEAAGSAGHGGRARASQAQPAQARPNVYQGQGDITEEELMRFLAVLPEFRTWSHASGETAHPVFAKGKADFLYSDNAAAWIHARGWNPVRFFCVMGRAAAGMTIVSEGNNLKTHPDDMPAVSEKECDLIRLHLGELLMAGSNNVPPLK